VRLLSATLIGAISGFLIYMIPAMFLEAGVISKVFVITTFVGGTGATFCLVLKGTQSTAQVWARGSLVWAAEWIVAALVPIYVSWLAFRESGVLSWGEFQAKANARSEAFMAALIGMGVCLFMALMCYFLYIVASRIRK
jgi:hypothetical protein